MDLLPIRRISTCTKLSLQRPFGLWRNIKVEDIHRDPQSGAGIGDINDPGDDAFDGSAGEEQVDLLPRVAWFDKHPVRMEV